jgi:hypothetical protein
MSSDNSCQRAGSTHSGRCASKVSSLLGRAQNSEHLQPLSDSAVGDAHGRAPIFRPVITFLPSRHRNKVDRFINRRGIIGLVGFAV